MVSLDRDASERIQNLEVRASALKQDCCIEWQNSSCSHHLIQCYGGNELNPGSHASVPALMDCGHTASDHQLMLRAIIITVNNRSR
jgi:hypothetical protein